MTEVHRPPPRPGWWNRQAQLCVPTLEEIGTTRPIGLPLFLVALLLTTAALLTGTLIPYAFRESPPAVVASLRTWFLVLGLVSPLLALLRAGLATAVTWSILTLGGHMVRTRSVFSLLLYGEIILALQGAVIAVTARILGPDRLHSPQDLLIPTGLDLLVTPNGPLMQTLVSHLSLFHLAWFFLLSAGIPIVTETSRRVGVAVALLLWILSIGVGLLRSLAGT